MIRNERAHLIVTARSHPGLVRKNNEDRYAVTAYRASPRDPAPVVFAVLADGIGGHRAGEVAAELAVDLITQRIAESDASQPLVTLQDAISYASQGILAHAQDDIGQQGMGATCACAWVIGSALFTASVGDSRIYLVRGDAIRQVSTDHTWVQEAIEHGLLDPEQAHTHRNSHVIRRYLGSPTPPQVDLRLRLDNEDGEDTARHNQGLRLHPGDILLLCSDGLTDLANEADILAVLKDQPLEAAAQALENLALQRGGHDNVTVILMQAPTVHIPNTKTQVLPKKPVRWLRRAALGCLAVLLLLAAAAAIALVAAGWLGFNLPVDLPFLHPAVTATLTAPATSPTPTLAPQVAPTLTLTSAPSVTQPGSPLPSATPGPSPTPWPTNTLQP